MRFSRRDFLALIAPALAGFLSACGRVLKPPPTVILAPSDTPSAKSPRDTATATQTETAEPTATASATATRASCVVLLTPEDGAVVPAIGKVTFAWEAMAEASSYQLDIIMPGGTVIPFETNQTTIVRYSEAFPMAGQYQWQVTALAGNDAAICTSPAFTFTREQPSRPGRGGQGGGSGGSGGSGSGQPPPPPPPTEGPHG